MDSELDPETPNWRTLVKNTVKCSDFKEYNDYCSAKAKQKVKCPYCDGEFSYCSMGHHIVMNHVQKEIKKNYQLQVKEQNKDYYEKNSENLIAQKKKYYKEHKEEITMKQKTKFECECGSYLTWGRRSKHLQTKKHVEALAIKHKGKTSS